MVFRLRILPLTMFAAFMLMAVKLADVVRGGEEFTRLMLVGSVEAQQKPPAPPPAPVSTKPPAAPTPPPAPAEGKPAAEAKPADAKPAEEKTAAEGKTAAAEKPAEGKAAEGKSEGKGEGKSEGKGEGKSGEGEKAAPQTSEPPPPEEPGSGHGLAPGARIFSPTEIDILQNLSKRREQLDSWGKDLEVKENLLSATEKRIDDKLAQVDTMKKELQEMIATYTNAEDAKIKSLVKIYEAMKPRDAARIFNELEMPVLLLVVDRMAEKKAAPVLAEMDPKKAERVTVELAEQRRLQNARLTPKPPAAKAPVAPTAPPKNP